MRYNDDIVMINRSSDPAELKGSMEGIVTVRELIEELKAQPLDSMVMIAVIKYPEEFAVRFKEDGPTWTDSSDVEMVPLESGEVTLHADGLVTIAVELEDYDRHRHYAGG